MLKWYKSRTMMATWTASAAACWYAATHAATKIVFQSQDEDRALVPIRNAKTLWDQSIGRLKDKWPLDAPLDKQAYDRLRFKNGSTLLGIPGDPAKIKSEHPTWYVQDESGIIKAGQEALNEAIATRCKKVLCISSAYPGWFADDYEQSLPAPWPVRASTSYIGQYATAEDPTDLDTSSAADPSFAMHGLRLLRGPSEKGSIPFIDLDIEADPYFRDPNSEQYQKLRKKFSPDSYFQREIKRKAYALSGATVYPEFDPSIHVVPHSMVPKSGCLYMGLDPHPRTPHAMLWILIDAFSDWWVYRELWPSRICGRAGKISDDDEDNHYSIREYTEAIVQMYEGNEIEWKNAETDKEYGKVVMKSSGERIIDRFMDQAGKGFVANEAEHETYALRYRKYGLTFRDPKKSHESGEDAIRQLLKARKHDTKGQWPRLHISDRCPELALEFRNYRYKQMKSVDPERDLHQKPADARSHLIDILRYLATSDAVYTPRLRSTRRAV